MTDAARQGMTIEAFLVWQRDQDEPYELVDGHPVPRDRPITGACLTRERATRNISASLETQFRSRPCSLTTTGDAIHADTLGGVCRPDLTVACAPPDAEADASREPKLAVDVLSCATSMIEQIGRIDAYQRHSSLACILLLETQAPQALLYRRTDNGWALEAFEGLKAVIALPEIGATLAMADIYEGHVPANRTLAGEG